MPAYPISVTPEEMSSLPSGSSSQLNTKVLTCKVWTLCGESSSSQCSTWPPSCDFSSLCSRPVAHLACLQCDSCFVGFNFLEVEGTANHVVHLEHWVSANKLASVVSLLSWEAKERGSFLFPRNVPLWAGESSAGQEHHSSLTKMLSRAWRKRVGVRPSETIPCILSTSENRSWLAGEGWSEAVTTWTRVRNKQRKKEKTQAALTRS